MSDREKNSEEAPEQPAPSLAEPSRRSRAERREQAARDVLRTFIRDLYVSRFGAIPPRDQEVELSIHVRVNPARDWDLQFDPGLPDQVLPQIEDAQADRNIYRHGRVYCFRCDSSDCEHSAPDSLRSVFLRYAPNGMPEWAELAQVLLEAKDPRVDRLFGKGKGAVALVQLGRDLRVQQLSSFGRSSKTYSILGQVIAGYFPLPNGKDGAERVAVTFQVVEVRGDGGDMRLRLNTISTLPDDQPIADLLGSGWQPGLHRAREGALRNLEAIEQKVLVARQQRDNEAVRIAMRGVPGVLRRLAESIERSERQSTRRTRHVEERRHDRRPVHKALDDLKRCSRGNAFFDEKAGTMIACGPQNRAHVFNPDGRHVTSFTLKSGAIDFRLRTNRWRRVSADEFSTFKQQVQNFIPKKT